MFLFKLIEAVEAASDYLRGQFSSSKCPSLLSSQTGRVQKSIRNKNTDNRQRTSEEDDKETHGKKVKIKKADQGKGR